MCVRVIHHLSLFPCGPSQLYFKLILTSMPLWHIPAVIVSVKSKQPSKTAALCLLCRLLKL